MYSLYTYMLVSPYTHTLWTILIGLHGPLSSSRVTVHIGYTGVTAAAWTRVYNAALLS